MKILNVRRIGSILIFTMLIVLGILGNAGAALADGPDITVTIGTNGVVSKSSETLILHTVDYPNYTGPWCPGLEKEGTIRIINQGFSQLKLSKLGLKFDDKLIQENFTLNLEQIVPSSEYLNRGEHADFKYIVKMKEDASDKLEGRSAILYFTVSLNEVPSNSGGGGSSKEHWAHDCIIALLQHNIIEPEVDINVSNNFENIRESNYENLQDKSYLDGSITRGEVAVFIGRALGLEDKKNGVNPYNDEIPSFARGYIISTFEAGLYRGYPDYDKNWNEVGRIFLANKYIPREELSCVLIRSFNKKTYSTNQLTFIDKDQISDWALQDVKAGVQNKVIAGFPDNTFRPKKNMTRGEFFALLCRLMGYDDEHNIKL